MFESTEGFESPARKPVVLCNTNMVLSKSSHFVTMHISSGLLQ